jgi:hypothetical protein
MQSTDSFWAANQGRPALVVQPRNAMLRSRPTSFATLLIRLIFHWPVMNSLDLRFIKFHHSVIDLRATISRVCGLFVYRLLRGWDFDSKAWPSVPMQRHG